MDTLICGGPSLFSAVRAFVSTCTEYVILAPYVRGEVLATFLDENPGKRCVAVVTTWRPRDVAFGSTDLEVYAVCKKHGVSLLLNDRLHLKIYAERSFERGLLTTANVSSRALGLREPWNHELGVLVDPIGVEGAAYLDRVIVESTPVTDEIYRVVREQADALTAPPDYEEEFEIPAELRARQFLLSDLPMCQGAHAFREALQGGPAVTDLERRLAAHDSVLYGITIEPVETFHARLAARFFDSPPIAALLAFNATGKQFGALTAWLHDRVQDVPAPRRYDIKEALQRVLRFVTELAPERYRLERFGAYSQTLVRLGEEEPGAVDPVGRLAGMRRWRRGGSSAPDKPLLVLYALGCLARGEKRLRFADHAEPLRCLFGEFGPPRRNARPEYAFWRLQNDGVWVVVGDDDLRRRARTGDVTASDLERAGAEGMFEPELLQGLLNDPSAISRAVDEILDGYFASSDQQRVAKAAGVESLRVR